MEICILGSNFFLQMGLRLLKIFIPSSLVSVVTGIVPYQTPKETQSSSQPFPCRGRKVQAASYMHTRHHIVGHFISFSKEQWSLPQEPACENVLIPFLCTHSSPDRDVLDNVLILTSQKSLELNHQHLGTSWYIISSLCPPVVTVSHESID